VGANVFVDTILDAQSEELWDFFGEELVLYLNLFRRGLF